jgi:PTS system nitrogen regulatory IIA component
MVQGCNFSSLLRRGNVYYQLPGKNPKEALRSLIDLIPPDCLKPPDKDKLFQAILEREELMPTAIGNGIALPHPRNPLVEKEEEQFAALAFPKNYIDWGALDGMPVHTIILVVSASAKMHLFSLQRITFFCHDETFCSLINRRVPAEEIFNYIEKTEQGW